MIVYVFLTCALVACIACCGWLAGKVNRLEASLLGQNSSVALQIVDVNKQLAVLRDEVAKLAVDKDAEESDMEDRIMDKLDKKWEAGIQAVLNYDPFSGRYEE